MRGNINIGRLAEIAFGFVKMGWLTEPALCMLSCLARPFAKKLLQFCKIIYINKPFRTRSGATAVYA